MTSETAAPPTLNDPAVYRERLAAYQAQQDADRHAPEPLGEFYARLALERIRAVTSDLRAGTWAPTEVERELARRAAEIRRSEPEGTGPFPEDGQLPAGQVAASQAAHDELVGTRLQELLGEAGPGADRHEHTAAFAELMRYCGHAFIGRTDDRYASLTAVTLPAVTEAVHLWHAVGWPDDDEEF